MSAAGRPGMPASLSRSARPFADRRPRRRRAARRARCARPGRSAPAGSCNAPKRCRRAQVQYRRPKPPSGCRTALQSRSSAAAVVRAALTGGTDGGRRGRQRRRSGRRFGRHARGNLCGFGCRRGAVSVCVVERAWSPASGVAGAAGAATLAPPLRQRPLRARELECAQPLVQATNGAELRERHHECGNGDHRNRQCGKQQHVEEVVHRSPHCADRGAGV